MPQADATPPTGAFADLGLHPVLVRTVEALGYDAPTPIQQEAIPPLLAGNDLLGLAATGTGKTAAFALPLLHGLASASREGGPYALILVPTRELARQVGKAVRQYGRDLDAEVLEVYGGASIHHQLQALRRGVDVVVATPGRALDLLERGSLILADIKLVVLDEADEMLDLGFQEDIESILKATPQERRTALFSATFPDRLREIARSHLRDPVRVEVGRGPESEGPKIKEQAYLVHREHKAAALARILAVQAPAATLVFCSTREGVEELAHALANGGIRAEALHGGLGQPERDRVLQRLRSGQAQLVVATDVAARGLDIDRLTHVVNFDLPKANDHYVHRIGRTGRAGREGTAITLVEPRERRKLWYIEQATGHRMNRETVPSVEELRAARMERLGRRVQDVVVEHDLSVYRELAEDLADELDPLDVAAAALRALAELTGVDGADEMEIPGSAAPPPRPVPRSQPMPPRSPARQHAPPEEESWVTLFLNVGREARVRPADVVGAITGETGLPGRAIGAIRVHERFTLVDVPGVLAERVMEGLRRGAIRGQKVGVRRDRRQGQ